MGEQNAEPGAPLPGRAYELQKPTLATARAALQGFYGPHSEDVWRTLLFSAGLTGEETDPAAFGRLITAMQTAAPLTRLCARGLSVRAAVYERLVEPQEKNGITA